MVDGHHHAQGAESRRVFPAQDVFVPWKLQKMEGDIQHSYHIDDSPDRNDDERLHSRDIYKRHVDNVAVFTFMHRYCHVYREGELEEMIGSVRGMRVVRGYYEASNWCVVAEKV